MVDRAAPGRIERGPPNVRRIGAHRRERQRRHHLPRYPGAEYDRRDEVCRHVGRGNRRGIDRHRQRPQSGRPSDPGRLFQGGDLPLTAPVGGAPADGGDVRLLSPAPARGMNRSLFPYLPASPDLLRNRKWYRLRCSGFDLYCGDSPDILGC